MEARPFRNEDRESNALQAAGPSDRDRVRRRLGSFAIGCASAYPVARRPSWLAPPAEPSFRPCQMPGHEKRFGPSACERWRSWRRSLLVAVLVAATLASVFFALRTYGSLLLLQSARAAGAPQASSIRAWMTLLYIAERYGVPSS